MNEQIDGKITMPLVPAGGDEQTAHMAEKTIRDIVVEDYRTAAVFRSHGLDFCCGGGAKLQAAAAKKGLDADALLAELDAVTAVPTGGEPRIEGWSPALIVAYIIENHHAWVRSVLPSLTAHAVKVNKVHGEGRPGLAEIEKITTTLAGELLAHMEREEKELFPAIVDGAGDTNVAALIDELDAEHTEAGDAMRELRRLTDDFTPPEGACTTWRVLYSELEEFERCLKFGELFLKLREVLLR